MADDSLMLLDIAADAPHRALGPDPEYVSASPVSKSRRSSRRSYPRAGRTMSRGSLNILAPSYAAEVAELPSFLADGIVVRPAAAFSAQPRVSVLWQVSKRVLDVVGALILIAIFSPLMLMVAGVIAGSKGGVLFRQMRVGRQGKLFSLYKFRTMVPNAEAVLETVLRNEPLLQEEWERNQKLRNDPRITTFGSFLRRTSIDELPQLFNVLRGEMSLVGPRPVLAAELERYGHDSMWYLAARPGITGLWQVSGRYGTGYARRVALDIHYVRSQRLWLDFVILFKTISVVILRVGAH